MTSGAGYGSQTSKPSHSGWREGGPWAAVCSSLKAAAANPRAVRDRRSNLLLFAVTLVELIVLLRLTTTFTLEDWIYVSENVLVLGISLTRRRPFTQDQSWPTALAVAISYIYPYAQVIYLNSIAGSPAWPEGGLALVTFSALMIVVGVAPWILMNTIQLGTAPLLARLGG